MLGTFLAPRRRGPVPHRPRGPRGWPPRSVRLHDSASPAGPARCPGRHRGRRNLRRTGDEQTGATDPPERAITLRRNPCSGSSGTGVHDLSESAFRMLRNTHRYLPFAIPVVTRSVAEGFRIPARHSYGEGFVFGNVNFAFLIETSTCLVV